MKRQMSWLVAFLAIVSATAAARADTASDAEAAFITRYRDSVAILVEENMQGNRRQICTATAFERNGDVYRFLTAAHCVATDDEEHDTVKLKNEDNRWLLTFDDAKSDAQLTYRVHVAAVGYQHRQDDFAILEATIKDHVVPLVPFAANPAHRLEKVLNIAAPQGLGKQDFIGTISNEDLDRPVKSDNINWMHAYVLQIPVAGGSSGSAVVSLEQKGIVAVLVGVINAGGGTYTIAIPIARFHKFWKLAKDGKYRWYQGEADEDAQPMDCSCKMKADGTLDEDNCFCHVIAAPKKKAHKK
jgi:hypothetical protein